MSPRHFTPSRGDAALSTLAFPTIVATVIAVAANVAYTVAQLLGGLLLVDPNGAARNNTLPGAADLVAAIEGADVGTAFEVLIRNTADAAETITVVAGVGGAISGTATIAQNNSKKFLIVLTSVTPGSEAYTAYSEGTMVH